MIQLNKKNNETYAITLQALICNKYKINHSINHNRINQKLIKLGDNNTEAKHQKNPIYSFRSAGMTQFTVATQKICLSSNDDKRYPLSNQPTTTLALGHYYIDEM